MSRKHLEAKGQGVYDYDFDNDILMFKIKEREYEKSIEFGNFIADIDKEGFITGLRVFDASQVFKMDKIALKGVKEFEFHTRVEDKVVEIQLRFTAMLRNKEIIKQGHDFIREAIGSDIKNGEVLCTVA